MVYVSTSILTSSSGLNSQCTLAIQLLFTAHSVQRLKRHMALSIHIGSSHNITSATMSEATALSRELIHIRRRLHSTHMLVRSLVLLHQSDWLSKAVLNLLPPRRCDPLRLTCGLTWGSLLTAPVDTNSPHTLSRDR